jgi:lipopolysaccharide/colanic/teichoic acid biosynthesis glycosyltransferase
MNPPVAERPSRAYELSKRAFDLVVVILALPLTVPVAMLIALAIRLDSPGSPWFVQYRTGRDGRRFRMYKFRTMIANAEDLKAGLSHLNVLQPPDYKIPDDPRITRVGRFLRATSLDELPQLWNVLRGDMSLVGPRPTSFTADTYSPWHYQRLEVRPGLTGLWQVTARGEVEFDERLRLDIAYLRQRSMATDLRILAQTVSAVRHRSGA